jgi:hypothetical protein
MLIKLISEWIDAAAIRPTTTLALHWLFRGLIQDIVAYSFFNLLVTLEIDLLDDLSDQLFALHVDSTWRHGHVKIKFLGYDLSV